MDDVPVRDGERAEELEDGDETGDRVKKPEPEHFCIESRGDWQEGREEHEHVLRDREDFRLIGFEGREAVEHRACPEQVASGVVGEGDC